MNKIFCIGFQKTGTTSLGNAFTALGYRVCGVCHELLPFLEKNDYQHLSDVVNQYDVFRDNPWPVLFRQLDMMYPGSKFILTIREESTWIKSVMNHFRQTPSPMLKYIYGHSYPSGHEKMFIETYRKHNTEVLAYFEKRPEDLLVIDLEEGNNWEKICGFLNIAIPDMMFPHDNKGAYTPVGRIRKYILKRVRARWRDLIE